MKSIYISSAILGVWFVTLFLGKVIGLSMCLFIIPFTLLIINILEKNGKIENPKAKILIIPIILLSITYLIFNNSFFNAINIFAIPILIALMIIELFNEKFIVELIIDKILDIFFVPLICIGVVLKKIKQNFKEKLNIKQTNENKKNIKKIVKSIFITIPIVFIIIGLLSSADEVFENIFTGIIDNIFTLISKIRISNLVKRIIFMACVSIYFLSFFDYIISRYEKKEKTKQIKTKVNDNFTIKMILGVLNLIYLLFCIIQIKSLFMITGDINYSQYARQGFFQLMIVSFINLVTILIAKRSENINETKGNQYINIMSLIMILFTFIILISSALRMYIYESAYGYTLLRLLVYCVLFTESILLIPTIMYILDKKIELSKVYFTIILTMYICMNFANFDYVIAKRNVDRYESTGKIDMRYLIYHTGTDAVSQLVRFLEINENNINNTKINEEKIVKNTEEANQNNTNQYYTDNIRNNNENINSAKTNARKYLKNIYNQLEERNMDFRDFNLSKIYAKHLLKNFK